MTGDLMIVQHAHSRHHCRLSIVAGGWRLEFVGGGAAW
jgi:hypothetical protein